MVKDKPALTGCDVEAGFSYTGNRGGSVMRWNGCSGALGLCALCLGIGILTAAIFPTGFLLFLVALLLIACGIICLSNGR